LREIEREREFEVWKAERWQRGRYICSSVRGWGKRNGRRIGVGSVEGEGFDQVGRKDKWLVVTDRPGFGR
jgi:hypothetical protein